MSRRRPTPLDQAYADRGLLRPGQARRALDCTSEMLNHLANQGRIRAVTFEWNGHTRTGYPEQRVQEMAANLAAGVPRARI